MKLVLVAIRHCKNFLSALKEVGEGVAFKANELRDARIKEAEANLNYKFEITLYPIIVLLQVHSFVIISV